MSKIAQIEELGFPKSLIIRENSLTSELIDTNDLVNDLNWQLCQAALDKNSCKLTKDEKMGILNEQDYLREYANALQDLMFELTGDNTCSKNYDPIDFGDDAIHSYAFNFKNGGRRHPLKDFENIDEVKRLMLAEAYSWIDNELTVPHGYVSASIFEGLRVRLENMEAKIMALDDKYTKSINH